MPTRRLTIQRETLTALTADDLALVAGAAAAHTLPLVYCLASNALGGCEHTSPCTT